MKINQFKKSYLKIKYFDGKFEKKSIYLSLHHKNLNFSLNILFKIKIQIINFFDLNLEKNVILIIAFKIK